MTYDIRIFNLKAEAEAEAEAKVKAGSIHWRLRLFNETYESLKEAEKGEKHGNGKGGEQRHWTPSCAGETGERWE